MPGCIWAVTTVQGKVKPGDNPYTLKRLYILRTDSIPYHGGADSQQAWCIAGCDGNRIERRRAQKAPDFLGNLNGDGFCLALQVIVTFEVGDFWGGAGGHRHRSSARKNR
ncbi:Uncharacterised protein [Serratia fonticola]|uniref:Uncharacterized protein n=1 Tax=Serratia fonticola TaxID=47917 RepID=A0A4U9UV53_SERFO|nr:Uncharacterised protein [Serratia fonticola]